MRLQDRLFLLLQHLLPQHGLSRLMGRCAESERVWLKNLLIRAAIRRFRIDLQSAKNQDPLSYKSFNAFFTRELSAPAASLFPELPKIGSPAEGIVSQLGAIQNGDLIQAKGRMYRIESLLAKHASAPAFVKGQFATLYLAPHNYHRVHCPVAGHLTEITYVPGRLFSVNLLTADHIDGLFARNERMIFHIDTPAGKVALVMVGAMLVAGMKNPFTTWTRQAMRSLQHKRFETPVPLTIGEELGYFDFGSTVVLCFENPALTWTLPAGSSVTLGQLMACY